VTDNQEIMKIGEGIVDELQAIIGGAIERLLDSGVDSRTVVLLTCSVVAELVHRQRVTCTSVGGEPAEVFNYVFPLSAGRPITNRDILEVGGAPIREDANPFGEGLKL
jgi:hypothetical protein